MDQETMDRLEDLTSEAFDASEYGIGRSGGYATMLRAFLDTQYAGEDFAAGARQAVYDLQNVVTDEDIGRVRARVRSWDDAPARLGDGFGAGVQVAYCNLYDDDRASD